jgi:hypothetical protein
MSTCVADRTAWAYLIFHTCRRQHPVVQQLIEIIGREVKLYQMFTEMIRIVFQSTPHPILSTLKFDVLMRLHEDDVREVSSCRLVV